MTSRKVWNYFGTR